MDEATAKVKQEIAQAASLYTLGKVMEARKAAEQKAWASMRNHQFAEFGSWATAWVAANLLLPRNLRAENPFACLVSQARAQEFE